MRKQIILAQDSRPSRNSRHFVSAFITDDYHPVSKQMGSKRFQVAKILFCNFISGRRPCEICGKNCLDPAINSSLDHWGKGLSLALCRTKWSAALARVPFPILWSIRQDIGFPNKSIWKPLLRVVLIVHVAKQGWAVRQEWPQPGSPPLRKPFPLA